MATRVERNRPRRPQARPLWLVLFCLVLAAPAGCRTDPVIALLERENRELEDMIYHQQDLIQRYRQTLNSGSSEREAPRDRTLSTQSERWQTPDLTLPEVVGPDLPGDTLPGADRSNLRETPSDRRGAEAPPFEPSPVDKEPADRQGAAPGPQADNARVTQITLMQWPGEGNHVSRRAGDEGINLLIEPRDAAGRLVAAAAPVSVVVLDPALTGQAARVARWDFPADQIAAGLGTTADGRGILLRTAWPAGPPVHGRLHVFVRYATDDGRNVEAETVINVAVAGEQGPSWQRAAARAAPPSEPTRTASLPAQSPSPHRPAATLRPPAWSPDRP